MHPKFQQYIEGREGKESLRLRVSSDEKAKLNDMLRVEGGNITELLVEGIWRVVVSRQSSSGQIVSPVVRPKQSKDEALNIRLSNTETAALSTIAIEEACPLGDLVGEGVWHVFVDRQQNKGYQAKAARILSLLNEVETTRATLHE